MGDVPFMGHERLADDFVVAVQDNFTFRRQILQKRRHVGREHLAGMLRHFAGKVCRAENRDTVIDQTAPRFGDGAVSTLLGSEIDNLEGIDVHVTPEGDTVLTLISDDNFSMIQRNLLLQFTLVD